jgi:hypothetical protein
VPCNVTNVARKARDIGRLDGKVTDDRPDFRWLLLIYRVSQDPPGRRTYVWRQLKLLGAVYLQQAAAVLPDRPEVRTALEALAERIRAQEGEVSLLETTSPSLEWQRELIQRFNTARDEEYAEIAENVERFEDEIRRETRKGKLTLRRARRHRVGLEDRPLA